MSLIRRNIIFNIFLSVSQILFPLVTFPYASRILGPEAIGAVSFADNFTTYFLIFAALGIPLYGVREIAKVKHDKEKLGIVFSELLIIHFFTSLIAVLTLFIIAFFTDKLKDNFTLYQIGMAVLMTSVFMAEWFFQGMEKFRFIAIRSVCIRLFTICLLFLLVHDVGDRDIYYALNLIAIVIGAAINMFAIVKLIKISYRNTSFKRHFRPLLIIFSNSIVTSVYLIFDTVILGFLTDDIHVGYYSAAMRISKVSIAVISALGTVLLPRLTLAFQKTDLTEAGAMVARSLDFVIILSIPIAMGMLCLSQEIILLFAGDKYTAAVDALYILSFIVVIIGIAQVYSTQILLPLHMEKKILYASVMGMLVSLLLNFSLIPVFKHVGAAISSLTTEAMVTVILFYYAYKAIRLTFPIKQFLQSIFTALFFFMFRYGILQFSSVPLIVISGTVVVSILFYFVMQLFVWRSPILSDILSRFTALDFLKKYTGHEQ
ncbi:flippase [Pedobacter sp. AW31-3R]|uniref:flippase n=1 Tax=Pedobacter sp. AW31-3R TaxID=3445781 RepID=UPI003FA04014